MEHHSFESTTDLRPQDRCAAMNQGLAAIHMRANVSLYIIQSKNRNFVQVGLDYMTEYTQCPDTRGARLGAGVAD